jgi:two-component system NtrC family sensor kinase
MKLTFKLVFALITLIVVILGVDAYFSVHRESKFLRAELQRKAYRIGNAMKELVADAWRRQGPENVLALIQAANQRDQLVIIRWVWLDGASTERFRPRVPADRLGRASHGETVTLQYRTPDGTECLLTYVTLFEHQSIARSP